jgi:adenylate cyclase, class 2
MNQPLEIEQKYRVSELAKIHSSLVSLQAASLPVESHCDSYFRHPCRDFGVTGEAFRLRQVNDQAVVTFKGPRLPGVVKTRTEIEIPLVEGTFDTWHSLLTNLGFIPLRQVCKTRRPFQLIRSEISLIIALDEVEGLGNFVEVETIVEDKSLIESCQQSILALAKELDLNQVEPRSYLTQLLALNP